MEKILSLIKFKKNNFNQKIYLSFLDIVGGIQNWRIWVTLGWQDIQQRYRRSVLGPIWITLSMVVMIYSLGFIYGGLFHMDLAKYFPHIASGMLIWTFIASMILEVVDTFIESAHYIKQIKLPFTTYILRILFRNYIVLAHNFVAMIPLLFYFQISSHILMILLGLVLIGLCSFSVGLTLAMLGARFRDIKPIVQNVLQLIFYMTPIMWMPEMLPQRLSFIVKFNPIHQLIELIRAPLIGNFPSSYSFNTSLMITGVSMVVMFWLFVRVRHRIAFWV